MSTLAIVLICVAGFIALNLAVVMFLSYLIYSNLLIRTSPDKWTRTCSMPEDKEYSAMYQTGIEWGDKYANFKRPVDIYSDRLHLFGEYFDFGHDKAVLIIAGRMEACNYSYYFAEPYRLSGHNVLVIDNRAHGLSDGRYYCLGEKEYRDALAWCSLLHDELKNNTVVIHGVCIGAATGLYAMISASCPSYVKGLIAEGMYNSFGESFKAHMTILKHNNFPWTYGVMAWLWLATGKNCMTDGPIKRIQRLNKPVLFMHSREDEFSLPDKAVELYGKCKADKTVVWFDKGKHSRIRPNDPQGFDRAIVEFLSKQGI